MKKAGATLVGLALLIVTAQAQYAPLCRQQCYAFARTWDAASSAGPIAQANLHALP